VGGSGAVVTKEPESEREKGPRNSSSSVSRSRSPYTPISYRDEDREKEQDKGKARDNSPRPRNSTSVARSGTPISYRDEDLLTTMRIPAPHAIEGYAPGIPTAGPSSGVNHFGGGYSTPRSRPTSGVGMPQLQPQSSLQLQPSNLDNGQRHTLDRRITEEELRRRSEEGGVENEVSSIEEVKVQKKLVKEGKIEVVENPKFMTEARRKELERERLREASMSTSTPVGKEEKKKFSFFPNPHLRRNESEGHADPASPANQQPVVEHEEEEEREAVTGASAVPVSSEGGSPSKVTGSPPKYSGSPSRGWFISGLKGFFGPRQPPTPQNSPTRQRSTKTKTTNANAPNSTTTITAVYNSKPLPSGNDSDVEGDSPQHTPTRQRSTKTKTTTNASAPNTTTTLTAVYNDRPLPSGNNSDVEDDSPSKPKGFQALFGRFPTKHKTTKSGGWNTRTDNNLREIRSERRGNSFDGVVPPRRGGIAGGAVKDVGVVSPAAAGSVTDLGARSGGSEQGHQRQKSSTRGRAVSDVGTSSRPTPAPGGRKLRKPRAAGPPVSASAAVAAAGENWSTVSVASSSNIGPSAPPPVAAAAPVPAAATPQPRPRTPIRAVSTSAVMGDAGKRRSASVDVSRKSRADPEDEKEGESMIVDLGSRRRTRSDVGSAKEKVKDTVPPMPTDSPMIRTASSSKGYFGDTAMVRSDSTRKAHTQAPPASVDPVAQHPISSTSTSTPSRKASTKSSTPSKSPGISSISGGATPAIHATATVLPAGGENPSGTLVPYPGWDAQAHAQPQGGSLSRHTSFGSTAASAHTAGKPTSSLGQGVGRKLTVGSGPAPVKTSTAATTVKRDVDAVAPRPAVPSLMSIVEDVSRSNRGWTEELKMRKSVGGSKTATANVLDGMLVRAPPPVTRGALEEMFGSRGSGAGGSPAVSTVGSGAKPSSLSSSSKGTGLFEVKAPGSVFDHRHALAASITTPPSKATTPAATSTIPAKPQKQTPAEAGVGLERRSTVRKAEGTTTSATLTPFSAPAVKAKSPLRSAMRSTSSSPSPMIAPGPSHVQHGEGRAPLSNGLAVGAHGAQQQQQRKPTQEQKGKAAPVPVRRDSKGSGADDGDSVSTVFYSDQGASESEGGEKGVVMNGSAVPTTTTVNGLEHGVRKQQSGSEISHSTVSTVVGGVSGQQQQQQHQTPVSSQQSQAESSRTPPRRRKSVRVSLKPTFSPSPPAIEYDYEEEHQRYAAWGRRHENEHERAEEGGRSHSPSRSLLPPPPPPPPLHPQTTAVVAPTPVRAAPVQHRLVGGGSGGVADMWDDSGEDEDEDYTRAKRLLARAAKKEKDTKLMIARGRA
jgi:hypothetical protein